MIKDLQKKIQEEKNKIKESIMAAVSQGLQLPENSTTVFLSDDMLRAEVNIALLNREGNDETHQIFVFSRTIGRSGVEHNISMRSQKNFKSGDNVLGIIPLYSSIPFDSCGFVFSIMDSFLAEEKKEEAVMSDEDAAKINENENVNE